MQKQSKQVSLYFHDEILFSSIDINNLEELECERKEKILAIYSVHLTGEDKKKVEKYLEDNYGW